MGSMMSSAFSDVSLKSSVMRKNKDFMVENFGLTTLSLNAIVFEELQRDVAKLNGQNNAKELAKMEGTFA